MPHHVTLRPVALCLGVAFLLGTTAASYALPEKEFLKQAIEGDNSEIALGKIAETKGATESVKSFGKTLVEDHTQARTQAATVARKLGMTPPEAPMPEATQEKAKLEKLSGSAFDQEFASYMVKDHEKDIAKFRAEAASGTGPVPELAKMTIPVLEKHLRMAEEIAKK